ncbi:cyclic pyranopterin monophosphate synthase MoaC [Selenomonas sp. TAMA-11512]|uniref:cyclic pyranopterin monophosphate synthase MoaC n=1 Tax=Selenomonas sp. TAMA-11512 TaxID=3095337 RepID=UPI003084CC6B|nr:cyclic pyranopterin monophosphate synthase MoaC [Selenomonas sp. TAMA-11512]
MEQEMTHFDRKGAAVMVDVSEKDITTREATAAGKITLSEEAYRIVVEGSAKKGDVFGVARLAGIMAAKKTSDLIPLCHPLPLAKCSVEFIPHEEEHAIEVQSTVKTTGKTGVEMEALTSVNIALLTIYDMVKAIDRGMVMSDIVLLEKSGGRSGRYVR